MQSCKWQPKGAAADFLQPFRVIEKLEILLNLNVTHVVPVTDMRRIQFIEDRGQFAFAWNFFVAAASFHAEPDVFEAA